MTEAATREEVVAFVSSRIREHVGGRVEPIDPDADLVELGVKSIDAVLISGDVEDHFGIEVDPVLLFECRTVNRIADSVTESLARR